MLSLALISTASSENDPVGEPSRVYISSSFGRYSLGEIYS